MGRRLEDSEPVRILIGAIRQTAVGQIVAQAGVVITSGGAYLRCSAIEY